MDRGLVSTSEKVEDELIELSRRCWLEGDSLLQQATATLPLCRRAQAGN